MSISQHLLIILILSHLVTILFIIFDVQEVIPIFVCKCRRSESSTKSEALYQIQKTLSNKVVKRENTTISGEKTEPSLREISVEDRWRHLLATARNMWLFFHHRFLSLKKLNLPLHAKRIVNYLEESGVEYYRVIWSETTELLRLEGRLDEQRRQAEILGEIVQKRIDNLQNPSHCDKAKVLLCKLTNKYGLASSLHDILWCFVKAYHENASLVLDIARWHYRIGNWENLFLSLSRNCINNQFHNFQNILLPGPNNAKARFELTLLPNDLGPSIVNVIDQPFAWWYGQFMKYIMRPNEKFKNYLASKKKEIGFNHPIVGIHVRRTDKIGKEAKYHDLEEYMYYVEDYYLRTELVEAEQERKVFIASDDPEILKECNRRFQRYTCLGFPQSAFLASNITSRYNNNSLWGTLLDLTLLAESDFLVCTFSSGFCRIAYELMNTVHPDAPNKVQSLDVEYFYAWQRTPDRIALYDHIPKIQGELWLHRNDVLRKKDEYAIGYEACNGKRRDGISEGVKIGTHESGSFPVFKTIEHYPIKKSYHVEEVND